MELSKADIKETELLAGILRRIDNIDADYVNSISDEIFQYQPFFLSALLGLRLDVTPAELDEVMKIYFLIWEYFRGDKKLKVIKVTQADFEKIQLRHIEMLRYMDDEFSQKEIGEITSSDLENIKSKVLLTAVLIRYDTRPVLMRMNDEMKGIVFIGVKSFIECFEKL